MAKIFYTLEEASLNLKMSEDQVKALVSSGQLQEFRDRDRLMFKVDQVNLLASGDMDGTNLGQSLIDSLDDCKNGRGQVFDCENEGPSVAANHRFGLFTEKEKSTLRTALITLSGTGNTEPEINDLLDEINRANALGNRRRGFFSRLFGDGIR